ncbi:MAG: putative metal-dependent hydrolase [Cytophagaceae bacterium]|nr:putative metal-dependent hydrolase [Cytophagaceae bacterium]
MNTSLEQLRFPIGKFEAPQVLTQDLLNSYLKDIETFPARLKQAVIGLNDSQLDTPYRPDGWTIRQVVNHCADSHMNSLVRFKLALTEEEPTIKPYYEERWAELVDSKTMPIESALLLLEGLHRRWTVLLKSLNSEELKKTFIHPEHGKRFRLDENIGVYAWHGNHHLAHITTLKKIKNW